MAQQPVTSINTAPPPRRDYLRVVRDDHLAPSAPSPTPTRARPPRSPDWAWLAIWGPVGGLGVAGISSYTLAALISPTALILSYAALVWLLIAVYTYKSRGQA